MKVIQIPFCFAPDPVGGTEVYVASVAQALIQLGLDVVVAAPGSSTCEYMSDGVRVRRFAVSKTLNLTQLYDSGDALAADEFVRILDQEAPDLVHLHSLTPAVSLRLVRFIKKRHIPIVFTFHTPTVTCQRGTLMRWGSEICDGVLNASRCAACSLHGAGLPRQLAQQVGKLPTNVGRWLGKHQLQGALWTALRMSELVSIRQANFRELAIEVDHFVAVCDWVRNVLLLNGVPKQKILVSRQGITWSQDKVGDLPASRGSGELRVAFAGRLDPTKGLHILIDAFRKSPELDMKLDVFGIVQSPSNAAYREKMLRLAHGDQRIAFREPVSSQNVVSTMRHYDVVAVPSRWLETGPMVVLEAFAAGVPVVAENFGGVAEIVRDGVDGLLIDQGAQTGWADALRRLALNREQLARLKAGVRPPRTSRDVAIEMLALYGSLVS